VFIIDLCYTLLSTILRSTFLISVLVAILSAITLRVVLHFFRKFASTMPRQTKRRRASRSALANFRRAKARRRQWAEMLEHLDERRSALRNATGRTCTVEENRLVLLAINCVLRSYLQLYDAGAIAITELTWANIDRAVASEMLKSAKTIRELRQTYMEDNEVLVFGEEHGEESTRGGGAKAYSFENTKKLTGHLLLKLIEFVDKEHADGCTVTNRRCRNFLRIEHQVKVSKSTMSRYFHRLGLSWQPCKSKKRRVGEYRMDAIRDYLIELDRLQKEMDADPNCKFVFVFTDESFIHQNHASQFSFLSEAHNIERSSSKGRRLIILHAISADGPMCERDQFGVPIDDLVWNGDTPHPEPSPDGKVTAECLWMAQSHTGDYHDNMNGEMFDKWIRDRLVPTFEKLYPGKEMVLIADNAPYHHKRRIESLANYKKAQLVELCKEHDVAHLDIPWNDRRFQARQASSDDEESDWCRVKFNETDWKAASKPSTPLVPTVAEMKEAIVRYFAEHRPDLLECKIEAFMKERGHRFLWTPPYCPELQPIELFWAAGKNHAADMNVGKRKMKQCIADLREGWYGNRHLFPDDATEDSVLAGNIRRRFKKPVDCSKLIAKSIHFANTKFIPLCAGIAGTIGALEVDPDHEKNTTGLPIDLFVIDLTRMDDAVAVEEEEAEQDEQEAQEAP